MNITMKKRFIYLSIIIYICVFSFVSYATDKGSKVEWTDGTNICIRNYDGLTGSVSLIDSVGKLLAENFFYIEVLSPGDEYAAFEIENGKGYFLTLNVLGEIKDKTEYSKYDGNAFYEFTGEKIKELRGENSSGFLYRKGEIIIGEKDGYYAIIDKTGKNITDFEYEICYPSEPGFYGKILLEGEFLTIADAGTGIILSDVIDIVLHEENACLIICNEDGKITLRDFRTLEIKGDSFEKYTGSMSSCVAFVKDGKNYVFNRYGNNVYEGKRDVRAVLGDCFAVYEDGKYILCDKEFKKVVSSEYDEVELLGEGLYIVRENNMFSFLSQGRIVLEKMDEIKCFGNLIYTDNGIYDIEGNKIYDVQMDETVHIVDNGIIVEKTNGAGIEIISRESYAPTMKVNGEFMLTDTLPRIENGRTLVPLRAFAEKMGFEVKNPDESGKIEISDEGKSISFTLGSYEAEADGKKISLEAAPKIINNRTLVPLRALCEAFDCTVEWDGEKREARVTFRK